MARSRKRKQFKTRNKRRNRKLTRRIKRGGLNLKQILAASAAAVGLGSASAMPVTSNSTAVSQYGITPNSTIYPNYPLNATNSTLSDTYSPGTIDWTSSNNTPYSDALVPEGSAISSINSTQPFSYNSDFGSVINRNNNTTPPVSMGDMTYGNTFNPTGMNQVDAISELGYNIKWNDQRTVINAPSLPSENGYDDKVGKDVNDIIASAIKKGFNVHANGLDKNKALFAVDNYFRSYDQNPTARGNEINIVPGVASSNAPPNTIVIPPAVYKTMLATPGIFDNMGKFMKYSIQSNPMMPDESSLHYTLPSAAVVANGNISYNPSWELS
jgi:hypothetical protein